MIGLRIYKTDLNTQEGLNAYTETAAWCNHNNAYIKDMGDYYEVCASELSSLSEEKEKKLFAIQQWTQARIVNGFTYNGVIYDSDMDTQITMQGIALNVNTERFAQEYPNGCPVRGYDEGSSVKTIHMLSAEEVLGFCAALSIHIGESKKLGWILQQRVADAKTKEELDAIVWAKIK